MTLDFTIDNGAFLELFAVYLAFFAVIFGISRAIGLLRR